MVVRRVADRDEFLAIMPTGRDRWQLPKGGINAGESIEQAALREVREEGGVVASVLADLGSINYFFRALGRGFAKTVNFYLMSYESGDPADHDQEVEEARWFPLDQSERLAFENERALVRRAGELLHAVGLPKMQTDSG